MAAKGELVECAKGDGRMVLATADQTGRQQFAETIDAAPGQPKMRLVDDWCFDRNSGEGDGALVTGTPSA